MLEIRYLENIQQIELNLVDDRQYWPFICNAIKENAEETSSIGAFSLRLPVWAFFSCRAAFVYTLQKNNITLSSDENVKKFLGLAKERQEEYNQAASKIQTEAELMGRLKDVGFSRPLTNAQKRNVLKLCSLSSGATFSVPGAGKTTEALAFFAFRKKQDSKLLVICPKNAFAAWEEQVKLCFKTGLKIIRLVGGEKNIRLSIKKNSDILLITYQQLPTVKEIVAEYLANNPTFVFLDESHHIKRGITGEWSRTVLSLAHLPVAKLIMTGTPLPNSPSDLIPQFNFIYPEIDATPENVEKLIKPIFVRTTKKELGLLEVYRISTPIQLKPSQRNLYELLRSEQARQLANISAKDRNNYRHIGKSVIRLLQVVSNPALLAKAEIDFPDGLFDTLVESDSPKIEYACYKARKLARDGKKVIIWSGFVENVELIANRLSDIGADYIHGGVDAGSEQEENTRENKIARFHNAKDAFILVANPAACAEGISLHTVCHHAIYVDRNYNVAQYLQSEDRIHRLGLAPNIKTTIEILTSPDTVDQSVLRRLNSKVAKMAKVLDDDSLNIEPVEVDLETDGLDEDDIKDFLKHLNREE